MAEPNPITLSTQATQNVAGERVAYSLREPLDDQPLDDWLIKAFSQLIMERTGIVFKSKTRAANDQKNLAKKILSRVQALGDISPAAYYQLLNEQTSASQASQQEWQQLNQLLTNGESFFFRDRGQFSLLQKHILPELIERRSAEKQLRICSAGCAAGEEPYSLAIVLNQLLPSGYSNGPSNGPSSDQEWDVVIHGVDLNVGAIAKAKTGLYRPWSLRGLSDMQKQAYFDVEEKLAGENSFQLKPQFQQHVQFHPLNLVRDSLTLCTERQAEGSAESEEDQQFDLIVCRNVFIYLTKDAIAKVVDKFYHALRPCGYLLTGHAELYEQNLDRFTMKSFPDSLIFQRPEQ